MSYYTIKTNSKYKLCSEGLELKNTSGDENAPLSIEYGGTGAIDFSSALNNLHGQQKNHFLDDISELDPKNNEIIAYTSGKLTTSLLKSDNVTNGAINELKISASSFGTGIAGGNNINNGISTKISVDRTVLRTVGDFNITGNISFSNNLSLESLNSSVVYKQHDVITMPAQITNLLLHDTQNAPCVIFINLDIICSFVSLEQRNCYYVSCKSIFNCNESSINKLGNCVKTHFGSSLFNDELIDINSDGSTINAILGSNVDFQVNWTVTSQTIISKL
jgi:hypothetical protein